jgi:hypothetical protein
VQEIRWEGGRIKPSGEYTLCYGKGSNSRKLDTRFFVHKRIISAFKRVQFVRDRISSWCHIIVINVVLSRCYHLVTIKMCQCPYIIKASEPVRCAYIHMMWI